ncbi:uncharacterized protein LOC126887445 [Diabrotica virgifera virgifera]|uniref:CHK kinase-like domain-containing protein n=1 Tax=Diabrotica virgifera virgifera TaxID=50390 RepID=A0ABM5KL67_DIAVI|nr:uncharacterized protein LOC126887445 [Diabrotica virgifera virgifera]XP_050510941.1 uncharacterized protein LOC126887445 [Diabrotica virgifera virgifera]XP_050510942.1 uncharacterized protein LOC126887445 [Diabrotica virgifera virgifera]XP_050510943.1 uncharacterized protein LOC126887445 [Diabrotica virgifera virgifera]
MADPITLPHVVRENLEALLKELNISEYDLNFSKGSSKGDNYLGIITKVKVVELNGSRILNLVIKSAPQALEFRNYIKIEILHEREVFMYEQVFPELVKFQENANLKDIFNPTPFCYKTSVTAPYEHLIFEDMMASGYMMKDRKCTTDLNHCTTVLQAYGKFHGLALALKIKKPEIYRRLSEAARESYFNNVDLNNLCKTVKAGTDKVVNKLNAKDDQLLIDKLNNFTEYPVNGLLENLSIEAADGEAVFCHGDCWINNLLFKYKEGSSAPSEVCILDWQLSRCASPAIDVSYFIFACTDKELRDSYYDRLLNTYYSSLSSVLLQFGCNSDVFSKETFLSHMKRFSKYGLMMCFIAVPLFAADLDEIPDWTANMNQGEREKMFTKERKSEAYIVKKLTEIAKDFVRLGYL